MLQARLAQSPPPELFTGGQLEALKWIALASMFVDHFGRLLLGFGQHTWVFTLGRIAFPLFAIVLALNLAREGDRAARTARTAWRLAAWCVVSVLPSIWARGDPWLVNIFGTLALGAALCWVLAESGRPLVRALVFAGVVLGCHYVEYDIMGVLLVPAIFAWRSQQRPEAAVLSMVLLLLTALLNERFGGWPAFAGTLAALPLAAAVWLLPVRVPRLQLGFYLVYPLHLALIGALRTWG